MFSSPDIWRMFFEEYYADEINRIADSWSAGEKRPLYVDVLRDLAIFMEGKLMEELFEYPKMVIEHAVKGVELTHNIFDVELKDCKVRFINLPQANRTTITGVRSSHISKFIGVEGLVRKATAVTPFSVLAAFRCMSCGEVVNNKVDFHPKAKLKPPYECRSCRSKRFKHEPDLDMYRDSQIITIQDYPENMRGGEEPRSINVFLTEDLTGIVNPGDRVLVNGVLNVLESDKAMGQVYIDANSIELLEKEYEEIDITNQDKEKIIEMGRDPDIVNRIIDSIAPSIFGYRQIKEAIALQLFSGVSKTLPDGSKKRGDIHILLVGDPGIAKSQLLRWVKNIAPRAIYTTGKGASSVGLTAAVTRDDLSGRWTLEAGALVLADKGIAIVDEIDKMRAEDRSALHEALEQQTITINKAGINAILRARCSLLSAANPKYGKFDRFTAISDQIDLEPTLLSRFDLIFTILDEPKKDVDERMADFILGVHSKSNDVKPEIQPEMLKKYIAYARRYVSPKLTEEIVDEIKRFYVDMRASVDPDSGIPITPRQLEAIIRLSEASARMRLRNFVEIQDVMRATKLIKASLESVAVDPDTGEIDMGRVLGTPKNTRDKILTIKKIIKELENSYQRGVPEKEIINFASEEGIEEQEVIQILNKMREHGDVYCSRYGYYKLVYE